MHHAWGRGNGGGRYRTPVWPLLTGVGTCVKRSAESADTYHMSAISAEHQISGIYTKMLIEFLVETRPSDLIEDLLRRAGESRSLDELDDGASWSSYRQFRRLLEERFRQDPTSLYQQAGLLCDYTRSHELSQTVQGVDSPGALLAVGSDNPLVPIRRFEKTEVAPNEWTVRE